MKILTGTKYIMRLVALTLLLAAVSSHGQLVSQRDLNMKALHLANPPKTRTDVPTVDRFTSGMDDDGNFNAILRELLVVRVAGSEEIKKVGKVSHSTLQKYGDFRYYFVEVLHFYSSSLMRWKALTGMSG